MFINPQETVREFKVGKEAKKFPSRDPVLVQEVKFMPGDGAQWIVMGYSSGLIRVITCDEETLMKKYVHAGGIFALAVHPSQSLLLSAGGRGGIINIWKWEENWTRETYKYGVVTQIKFGTDTFTTCEYKGRIEVWLKIPDVVSFVDSCVVGIDLNFIFFIYSRI